MAIHSMNEDPSTNAHATRKRRVLAAGALALAAAVVLGMVVLHGRPAPSVAAVGAPSADDASRVEAAAVGAGTAETPHRTVKAAVPEPRTTIASAALPPANAPLAKIYDELKARAEAGDAQAASQLYRDVHRCALARHDLRTLPRFVSRELDDDTTKLDAGQLTRREAHLASMEERLMKAQADSDGCGDLTEAQLALTPIALRAAQLGDLAASNCYVGGSILNGQGILDHPEWLTQYKDNALKVALAAVDEGDWKMVAQLQRAYAGGFGSTLFSQVTGLDAAQAYRYMKLRRLGSPEDKTAYFDKELGYAAQGLSASDISAGDAWAQDAYQRYFGSNPVNNVVRNTNVCEDDG
jgi:hypothetical protein